MLISCPNPLILLHKILGWVLIHNVLNFHSDSKYGTLPYRAWKDLLISILDSLAHFTAPTLSTNYSKSTHPIKSIF